MKRIALQFSGGRDSTATLCSIRDILDHVVVLHVDGGSEYPHITKFIVDICDHFDAELIVVRPETSSEEWTEKVGYPSDILPIWSHGLAPIQSRDQISQPLISPWECCQRNLWEPAARYVLENNIKTVIRGVREVDHHRGVPPGYIDQNGVRYEAPIWNWSEERIDRILLANEVELPLQYKVEGADSLDCWCCTGHSGFGEATAKLQFMQKEYPELFTKLKKRHEVVRRTILEDTTKVFEDIDNGLSTL